LDRDRLVLLEVDVAVDVHAGAGGDEAADDHVFLQASQVVDASRDRGFGENASRFLERCGGDEGVCRE